MKKSIRVLSLSFGLFASMSAFASYASPTQSVNAMPYPAMSERNQDANEKNNHPVERREQHQDHERMIQEHAEHSAHQREVNQSRQRIEMQQHATGH